MEAYQVFSGSNDAAHVQCANFICAFITWL